MSGADAKANVVVVNALRLRRAGILRLIEDWAVLNDLAVTAVAHLGLPTEFERKLNCRLVVLNIGGASVSCKETESCMRAVLSLLPAAPLVLVSDEERAEDVIGAFRAGARGYIPTSTDPAVALHALTFILGGGSYFPPSALLSATMSPEAAPDAKGSPAKDRGEAPAKSLTLRQQEVVHLLREGMPNKVIARQLHMTEATVKVHVRQIMRKFGASNRTQAALCAAQAAELILGGIVSGADVRVAS